mmetsp:Transcript_23607/g.39597  ORF Transcript_23607/g.39597 Transcript_23607/m.39597 type:complete len:285 (+) Transcript_23607:73-927(+)|eukprot:CAMPEP_0198222596 /NCGR_PEP_ID=MMETSP1445-20131203/88794_1 /TAXON_ID=36898 /ORGANISM="Pyramimonas sp., Strain CCMP2087" /LENGTH=284 /DNA_ID=CAMNT_0043901151 /DNA_START=61 /DNA_END=915 /DNA_ORIENTATION=-
MTAKRYGLVGASFNWDNIRVLLFDLDDTLWDCQQTLARATEKFAEKYPQFANMNQIEEIEKVKKAFPEQSHDFTFLRKQYLREFALSCQGTEDVSAGDAQIDKRVNEQFEYWHRWRNTPAWFGEIVDALRKVKALERQSKKTGRFVIGAVTDGNSMPSEIPELVEILDFTVRAQEVGFSKPHPRIFEVALQKAREAFVGKTAKAQSGDPTLEEEELAPSQVLMVGDNIVKDVGGGLQAGFRTCWVAAPLGVPLEATFDSEEVCDFVYPTTQEFLEKEVLRIYAA